ncbi:hypothetical protein [Cryptosporangium japonicum]|uniref:Lipocalin-like domain-containing protein n=1 Tax=Cryptosporangium japonicum TaxID=80872 RepID=A0ABP3D6I8_9ACTN
MTVDGAWDLRIQSPSGDQPARADFVGTGDQLAGSYTGMGTTVEITEGTVEGDVASWTVDRREPFPMTSRFRVTVTGDELAGEVEVGTFGSFRIVGTRG